MALLQSRVHEIWARFFSSTMEDRLRYSIVDAFRTFPRIDNLSLEISGNTYHHHRASLMVTRNEGLTKTYNRFHARGERGADILRLRQLHAEMDAAVLHAYGWHDLADLAVPIFLDEADEPEHAYQGRLFWPSDFRDEVLARLLALNAERAAEERALGLLPPADDDEAADEDAA